MGKMLGIDLGTTNSCVSIYTENEMRVLHLEANKDTLPSVVRFVDRKLDDVVVGTPAKRMMNWKVMLTPHCPAMRISRMRLCAISTSRPKMVICATVRSGSWGAREMSTASPE